MCLPMNIYVLMKPVYASARCFADMRWGFAWITHCHRPSMFLPIIVNLWYFTKKSCHYNFGANVCMLFPMIWWKGLHRKTVGSTIFLFKKGLIIVTCRWKYYEMTQYWSLHTRKCFQEKIIFLFLIVKMDKEEIRII